jgi:hypothetical protein
MGLFLAMSGVVGGSGTSVVDALRTYAESNEGSLKAEKLTTDDDVCLVISEGMNGVTVMYPSGFYEWDNAAQHLSQQLAKPVFSFHIHDGDFWMYSLYEKGEIVDQFNPVPDYWGDLDEEERRTWQGDATKVARLVPGLSPERVSKYLVQWGNDVFESDRRKKAYPTDQFHYGDDWQLIDFMNQLKLPYPVDDRGDLHGITYSFVCKPLAE